MHKFCPVISTRFTRLCLTVGTLSGITAFGLSGQAAWADSSCTAPSNGPTGPGAATFVYQCDGTYAGDWKNDYYVYNPATGAQTPLYTPDYTYNCTTNTWTQAEWDYDAGSGAYIENRVAATAPPDQPTNCATVDSSNTTNANAGSGNVATTPNTSNPSNATDGSAAATAPPDPNTACPTPGAAPTSSATDGTANNSVTMNNTVCSDSQSGNASVTDNHHAGDATSGDATTEVNVANLVNSLSSTSNSSTVTFTTDIDGNVNGNLVLDPSTLGVGSTGTATSSTVGTVNTDTAINNAITATAVSGDATVSGNGEGGNATSGDAEAIVNLINMINSAIASGQSFIGTININGDLNGDILIPQSVIDQLLASNADGNSGSSASNSTSNESITNNVNASATSGDATVVDNGSGGDATSGNAKTNVTILNLTGSSVVGKNVLLVFVNVLGQWVGMILNAPAGATSAEFGGGITSDTASTGSNLVDANATLSITNNVNASATSGDATVVDNGSGGDATSGNASTAVNILNIEDSTLSLANWFGILFINVFGTWNGNFGIAPTVASTESASPSNTDSTLPTVELAVAHPTHAHHSFASFVPNTAASTDSEAAVLGDTTPATSLQDVAKTTPNPDNKPHTSYTLPIIGFGVAACILAVSERDRLFRKK